MLLKVTDLNVYYGAIHALKGLSFEVGEGEIVSLIGANGAGKTTAMHTVSGLLRSRTGSVEFMDTNITKTEPHRIVKMGLAQVPEGRRVFASMSVLENLEMGAYIRTAASKKGIDEDLEMVFTRFPRLKERRKQVAGTLSGGEQQMLAIGRALMSRPPDAAPRRAVDGAVPHPGAGDLLLYHRGQPGRHHHPSGGTERENGPDGVSDRAYVLETGSVVLEGRAADLLDNEQVKEAYLGA